MPRTDFRAAAARRLSEDTDLSPAIVSLLTPDSPTRSVGVRIVPVDHIEPNPEQPRMVFEPTALDELAASIREHGVLQPILVRPLGPNTYQIVAGERRWRASRLAGLESIPALIEEIDDDTALEIAIIENLQREDLTPLDEAAMYDRMVHEHGYSIRKLADKLGKDKGYLENRLRLADAPPEIRELVSLRKDSLSHAYELMKVEDPKKRRRLAEQVARGELTLIKLRDKIEGRRPRATPDGEDTIEVRRGGRRRRRTSTTPRAQPERRGPARTLPRRATSRRLAGQRQAEPGRRGRRAGRCPGQCRGPRFDRSDRPGEPRQVPDHRQAPPRERDRHGPERGQRPTESPTSARACAYPPSGTPASQAAASSRDTDRLELPRPLASGRVAATTERDADSDDDGRASAPAIAAGRPSAPCRRVPATSVSQATPTTATRRIAWTAQRGTAPSLVATESVPAATSRSTSASALETARAAPATTAVGSRTANAAGRSPVVPEPAVDGQERDPDREREP